MKFSSFSIKLAISRHEFVSFYQPVVQANTNIIAGCDVFIRWLHPQYGLLNTDEFTTSIRRNNMLMPVMTDLMHNISLNIASFSSVLSGDFILSINCSASLLLLPAFCEQLVRMTQRCQQAGITVLAALSVDEDAPSLPDMYRITHSLRAQGVVFALNGYTGQYRDYDLLVAAHPEYIRLDKHYLSCPDIPSGKQRQDDIDNIIHLACQTGMKLVMPGVENNIHSGYLKNKAINYWQGGLCGNPMPPELFLYHLAKQKNAKRNALSTTDRKPVSTH